MLADRRFISSFIFVGTLLIGCSSPTPDAGAISLAPPPVAPIDPVTDVYHGVNVVDPYRYLEDVESPEVQAWFRGQADYSRAVLDAIPGRAGLLSRIRELWQSTPVQVSQLTIVKGNYYTLQLPAGANQPRLVVRQGPDGTDRLLVDPEKLPGGEEGLLSIQWFSPSPDNRYVAYSLASAGTEDGVMHILDTSTGAELPETADRARFGGVAWREDNHSFYFTRMQQMLPGMPVTAKYQNLKIYLHQIGRPFEEDQPILGAELTTQGLSIDPREIPILVTRTGSRFAVAILVNGVENNYRVYVAPITGLGQPETVWRGIATSTEDRVTDLDLHNDTLYWITQKNAEYGTIQALDLSRNDSRPWQVVPAGEFPISNLLAGSKALYWLANDAGIHSVSRIGYASGSSPQSLELPYPADLSNLIGDAEGDALVLRAASWVHASAYLAVEPSSGKVTPTTLQPVGKWDSPNLTVAEVRVKSWDGTQVPLSIVYRKGLKLDGTHPTMLQGYGAYGISSSPGYSPASLAIYERDVIRAVCHVRGGGELGEPWHQAGFQATKPNTWKDLIACAEYLVAEGYTSPAKLVVNGGSAGGILVGRSIEERPDLFGAAVAMVPVTDLLRSETTANGVPNIPEFGSVQTEAGFKALLEMSPYEHVKAGTSYPAVLITTGINDPRVDAWEPAKLAARLQAATSSGRPILFSVDYLGGHGVGSSIDQSMSDLADMMAFAFWQTDQPGFRLKVEQVVK